jgi:cytoskeletal protein CcmA (bactofilin family)
MIGWPARAEEDTMKEGAMLGRDSGQGFPESPYAHEPADSRTPLLSIVGSSAKIEGTFEIADTIRIECEVGGELNVGKKLVIGQNGVVTANVRTVDAVIMGRYEGNMVATGDVEITATGRVTGNLETDSLVIAKGGFFNGNVARIKEDSQEQKPPRPLYLIEEKRLSAVR